MKTEMIIAAHLTGAALCLILHTLISHARYIWTQEFGNKWDWRFWR